MNSTSFAKAEHYFCSRCWFSSWAWDRLLLNSGAFPVAQKYSLLNARQWDGPTSQLLLRAWYQS